MVTGLIPQYFRVQYKIDGVSGERSGVRLTLYLQPLGRTQSRLFELFRDACYALTYANIIKKA